GLEDVNDTGTVTNPAFSGTFIAPASNGRGIAHITAGSSTSNFAFYVVSQNKILFVSLDFVPALLGVAERRSTSAFSNAFLSNDYVFDQDGFTVNGKYAAVGRFHANGNGGISLGVEDVNEEGSLAEAIGFSGSYQVASNGRGQAPISSQLGTSTYVFYLVSPTLGFFMYIASRHGGTRRGGEHCV